MIKAVRYASLLLPLLLGACSSSDSEPAPQPEPTELKTSDAPSIDTPEAQLFHEAKRLYRAGLYTVAIDSFNSLRVNYPLSPYVEFAEIKIGDAQFETRDFGVAAGTYEEFLKTHPASNAVPYVMLRAGRSHQLTNRGVGRDVAPLEKARDLYTKLIETYPGGMYAKQASVYLAEVNEDIAKNEKLVMRFYRRKDNVKAVEAREKVLQEKQQLAASAAAMKEKALQPVPLPPQREEPVVLAASRANPQKKGAQGPLTASAKDSSALLLASAEEAATLDVQRIQCRGDKVFIFLRSTLPADSIPAEQQILAPKDGVASLKLPGMSARPAVIDCLSKGDLRVSADGLIELKTGHSWDVFSLDNPARLLLSQR